MPRRELYLDVGVHHSKIHGHKQHLAWEFNRVQALIHGPRQEDKQRRVLSLPPMGLLGQQYLEQLCQLRMEEHSVALVLQLNLLRNNRDSCKLLHLHLGSYLL